MPHTPRLFLASLLILCLSLPIPVAMAAPGYAPKGSRDKNEKNKDKAKDVIADGDAADSENGDDQDDEDQVEAAVQLDTTGDTPLILALYQATRETKEKKILEKIQQAHDLVEKDADVKATDKQGRTALHWAVFGTSYSTKPNVISAYADLAALMLDKGADINHEDMYQDTPLDYLLYSPNFELQTLLLERGATSGFFNAFFEYVENSSNEGPAKLKVKPEPTLFRSDLIPGQTLHIRLNTPVWSDKSRTGDPVEAVVTSPLMRGNEVLIRPGARIEGTVLFAQKAPDKYWRPRLVLDFSNIIHLNGSKSPLYSRVLAVDNARETVRNNEIFGIVQPHASSKISMALSAVGVVNPIAGYAVRGAQAAYGLSIRREISFRAGTDMTIQVTRASRLHNRDPWPGWPALPMHPDLQKLVQSAPLRTQSGDTLSDMTNLMFIGTQQQVQTAFEEAGWSSANRIGVMSSAKTFQATIRQTGYEDAPVSLLTLNGAPPDMVYQKSLDTFAKRHHLRIWKQSTTYQGREVWIASATHDIGLGNGRKGTKWFHRIDPRVDRERERVKTDLLFSGVANGFALVERPNAPKKAQNATGDDLITDGKMMVLTMGSPKRETVQKQSGR